LIAEMQPQTDSNEYNYSIAVRLYLHGIAQETGKNDFQLPNCSAS